MRGGTLQGAGERPASEKLDWRLMLPVFIIVLLMFLNPNYIDMFFTTSSGRMMLIVCVVMEAIGFSIVRKIVNIKM